MKDIKAQSVLKAWHLIESLTPSLVDGKGEKISKYFFKDSIARSRTRLVNFNEEPWKYEKVKDASKNKIYFRYYVNCFEQHKLVSIIRDLFNNRDEIINHDYKTLFSLTFLVDSYGKYIEDSLFVPFLMYALRVLKDNLHVDYADLNVAYEGQMKLFEEQVQTIFVDEVSEHSLNKLQNLYNENFYTLEGSTMQYLEIERMRVNQQPITKNFNSFYLDDLAQILSKSENETLLNFIKGQLTEKRFEIDEDKKYIEDILQPINIPNGRWPSPVEHRLSLMQQVAVNEILSDRQKINSVNGPPGTGKTTLLKDVFANIVVKRAHEMTNLSHPNLAFNHLKTINLDGYNYPIYALDEQLNKYSMVVASSNNGAVENISKDLPQKSEIIREQEKGKFLEYETHYANEAKALDMYPAAAKSLIGGSSETWGMFSGILGNSRNISSYYKALYDNKDDEYLFINELEKDAKQYELKDWEAAVSDFRKVHDDIQEMKRKLQDFHDTYKKNQSCVKQVKLLDKEIEMLYKNKQHLENDISFLEQQKELLNEQIQSLGNVSLLGKLFNKKDNNRKELQQEFSEIISGLRDKYKDLHNLDKDVKEKTNNKEKLQGIIIKFKQLENEYKIQRLIIPEGEYWSKNKGAYDFRQQNTPWLTDELNFKRGLLFLKAMKVHKIVLSFNFKAIKSTLRLLKFRHKLDINDSEHRVYLKNMWENLHLVTPLVSTTFASFGTMFKGIDNDFIDYLFIDEAGQASPQQAAGAFWRSKRAIVVGDPIQIEPVVTIEQTMLNDIKKHYKLEDKYVSLGTSVQSLADQANVYGMYNSHGQWIGIPLWVHRRCLDPMFTIANDIAYDNKMVLGKQGKGTSIWFDCKDSTTNRQFVLKQGELVANQIIALWKENGGPPDAYIISPFTAVKDGVKKILKQKLQAINIPKNLINDWINKSVGTVHTFQGKEAKIVYLVIGTDDKSDGAANWSCSKPNLLNVAVTRAKEVLYIVGDFNRLSKKPIYSSISNNVQEVRNSNVKLYKELTSF